MKKTLYKVSLILSIITIITILLKTTYAFGIGEIVDGAAGILLLPVKLILVVFGDAIGIVLNLFAGGNSTGMMLSIQEILFNKVPLTEIDFFNFSSTNSTVISIRESIATWYVSIRNLSAVILFIICVYVGIRMAIATIAEEKAKYKDMLFDWLVSLSLLFVLHYIMIMVIYLNNTFIEVLTPSTAAVGDYATVFKDEALEVLNTFSHGMGNAMCYVILQAMTFIFLLTYIKRMITLAFLIIIAPLVTTTYAIDKMGDGKSQALNIWFKEFTYNILIQPFQCVAYLALGGIAVDLVKDKNGLENAIFAIIVFMFIMQSEKIIKHIFHFESRSMAETAGAAALTMAVASRIGNSKKKAGIKTAEGDSGKPGASTNTEKEKSGVSGKNSTTRKTTAQASKNTNGNPHRKQRKGQGKGKARNPVKDIEYKSTGVQDSKPRNVGYTARKFGRKALRGVMNLNLKAAGVLGGFAVGAATGDTKTALATMGTLGGYMSKKLKNTEGRLGMDEMSTSKRRVARTYNRLKESNPAMTDEQIQKFGKDLLDGKKEAKTVEEREYRDALRDNRNRFLESGKDKDESTKATMKIVKGVEEGKVSETYAPMKLAGKIKKRAYKKHPGRHIDKVQEKIDKSQEKMNESKPGTVSYTNAERKNAKAKKDMEMILETPTGKEIDSLQKELKVSMEKMKNNKNNKKQYEKEKAKSEEIRNRINQLKEM